jgi:hypothetical protein
VATVNPIEYLCRVGIVTGVSPHRCFDQRPALPVVSRVQDQQRSRREPASSISVPIAEWRTKHDPNRISVCNEGYIVTVPRVQPVLAESEGKPPADFDRRIEILDEHGGAVEIDEDMLLEAMPDFIQFLPRDLDEFA